MTNHEPGSGGGGGGGGGSGGGSGGDDGGDGGDDRGRAAKVIASALATWLGVELGTLDQLSGFLDRLSDAGSLRELVLDIILTEIVSAILSVGEVVIGRALQFIEILSVALWQSTIVPLRTAFSGVWTAVFDALEGVRLATESALAGVGLAAPLVALGGWVAVLLVVTILASVVWAVAETYLPTEAITDSARSVREAASIPLDVASTLVSNGARTLRQYLGGDTNE